ELANRRPGALLFLRRNPNHVAGAKVAGLGGRDLPSGGGKRDPRATSVGPRRVSSGRVHVVADAPSLQIGDETGCDDLALHRYRGSAARDDDEIAVEQRHVAALVTLGEE